MTMTALEVYSEPSRTSKMELIAKIIKDIQPLTIFAKCSILDAQLGSKCDSVLLTL